MDSISGIAKIVNDIGLPAFCLIMTFYLLQYTWKQYKELVMLMMEELKEAHRK